MNLKWLTLVLLAIILFGTSCYSDEEEQAREALYRADASFYGDVTETVTVMCSTGEFYEVSATFTYTSPGYNRGEDIHDVFIVPSLRISIRDAFKNRSRRELVRMDWSEIEYLVEELLMEALSERGISTEHFGITQMDEVDSY